MDKAYDLLATKTLTISKLMVLTPPGTLDPSPHLYDTTMYSLSGLMVAAVIAHGMVKPLKEPIVIDISTDRTTEGGSTQAVHKSVDKISDTVGDREIKK